MVRFRRVIEASEDGRGASQLGIRPGRRSLPSANGEVKSSTDFGKGSVGMDLGQVAAVLEGAAQPDFDISHSDVAADEGPPRKRASVATAVARALDAAQPRHVGGAERDPAERVLPQVELERTQRERVQVLEFRREFVLDYFVHVRVGIAVQLTRYSCDDRRKAENKSIVDETYGLMHIEIKKYGV